MTAQQVLKEAIWKIGIVDDAGYFGGAEKLADELLKALKEAGFEVTPAPGQGT